MSQQLRSDLLNALAAGIHGQGRLLPCAALRRLIEQSAPRRLNSEIFDQALLLAALYGRLAGCLLQDLAEGTEALEPAHARWRQEILPAAKPKQVLARRFQLAPQRPSGPVQVPLTTHDFLVSLPPDWLAELVGWAPPVISRLETSDSPAPVLGNALSAFLASKVIPDRLVTVRILKASTHARFSLLDLAWFAGKVLPPICEKHRNRIICLAPTPLGQQLTGLKRSTTFLIRQRDPGRAAA